MTARTTLVATVLVLVAASTGCAGERYQRDGALRIVTPAAGSTVRLPMSVVWSGSGVPGAVTYAVLVDQQPPKPSRSLLSLVPSSDPCRRSAGCPDDAWLKTRQVAVTASRSVTFESIYRGLSSRRTHDVHELVVIPLDARGRRIGEVAEVRSFSIDRSEVEQ